MSAALLLAIIVVGIAGSAFFSGAEIAIISSNRLRIHHLARDGDRSAGTVLRLLESPRKVVTTTLLGTNFFNVATAAAATGLFSILMEGQGAVVATAVITPLILVFGEIFPKTLFRQYADGIILRIAVPLDLAYRLLTPLIRLSEWFTVAALKAVGAGADRQTQLVTREEIQLLLSEGERLGLLRSEGRKMIHRTFSLSETRVKTVMVPLVEVFALEENTPLDEALVSITERGHSRVPIYRDRIDNIVGMLYVFDLLDPPVPSTVGEMMHPAYYVPETKGLQQLLLEMKQSRMHQAVVVDEFGGASGIVTLEDALEKIVGEIRDEFDRVEPPSATGGEEWSIVDARLALDELERRVGVSLPEGDYETLGGYLTDAFGRIPEPGEIHTFGKWEFEVLDATPRRIARLRVRRRRTDGASLRPS
ncbi:MAG: hemolysin family protein [bacterium]